MALPAARLPDPCHERLGRRVRARPRRPPRPDDCLLRGEGEGRRPLRRPARDGLSREGRDGSRGPPRRGSPDSRSSPVARLDSTSRPSATGTSRSCRTRSDSAPADDQVHLGAAGSPDSGTRALADHLAHATRAGSPDAADRAVPRADPRTGAFQRHADHARHDAAHAWVAAAGEAEAVAAAAVAEEVEEEEEEEEEEDSP